MEQKLTKVNVKLLTDNLFRLLDNDWMLVTAGNNKSFNTMTASWGAFGILWNKPIAICFIRPQRYTMEFIHKNDSFTLSFFTEKYHEVLSYCGSHSGKDTDKIKHTGLTPMATEHGGVYFSEARLMLECKKLYADKFNPENFMVTNLVKDIYPKKDFHHFFIGEIITCLSDATVKEKNIPLENIGE
jgi:flavin reductase (DIM6/NTAB) family NADH-FMN oxidoreductase RutF